MAVYKDGKSGGQRPVVVRYGPAPLPPVQVAPPKTVPEVKAEESSEDSAMKSLAAVLAKEMASGDLMSGLNIGKVTKTVKHPKGK